MLLCKWEQQMVWHFWEAVVDTFCRHARNFKAAFEPRRDWGLSFPFICAIFFFFCLFYSLQIFITGPIHICYWHANWLPRSQEDESVSSHSTLTPASASISSDHLWSDLTSSLYRQNKPTITAKTNGCYVFFFVVVCFYHFKKTEINKKKKKISSKRMFNIVCNVPFNPTTTISEWFV